ncbi:MAG TPA: maltose alpha-D-glucosyltransferase [Tepidisphaeraceae bacterium]|nr:maltose alpha-D-glucosyltransferase [Tepidisphaeraceae bacterium]
MTDTLTISHPAAPVRRPIAPAAMPDDPLWYRNAVIYQLHVRSFSDSNGDGIGDFNGLISKLDYLQELGVTAIWLLPFYPSPLKDDGYDIAEYQNVNPAYGTIDDAMRFIEEAHRRQLRVITELVINHTSDQHKWFQRARRAPRGSPEREFYVWSDDPEKYAGVRIIFKDYERSNWTFDHTAGQYYWHRFFSHQPDLNFDNPLVHQAVFAAFEFWLNAGVDGLRLDAVPYLYEREGTSCENLPETHAFLKKLRTFVDTRYPGRMLLAEANQWPEDAVQYFGDGDECHMNFHFPLMPRLFMSVRMEDRYPIIDILEQTPAIPANAQWAMFLRNHDELTLEMVTDEERDYMWRVYASDPVARINMGIRRRLSPLMENSRRKIELMNALLFSMPGSPIVYYGDEIGMGDNIFLGDRNGVRTPMQWSADRNAGFSRANPQRLLLPVIIDPEYHYETINVEAQNGNPSSLLWWMKRLIALRKRTPALGRGDVRFLHPANAKVLAFVRTDEEQQVLVVANLSRLSQPVELELSAFAGFTPIEMFGNVRFPAIAADGKYTLSLTPHGYYWFLLVPPRGHAAADADGSRRPEIRIGASEGELLADDEFQRQLEEHLPRILPQRRWFVSKARSIAHVDVTERLLVRGDAQTSRALFLLRVDFDEGEPEDYALPLIATAEPEAATAAGTVAPASVDIPPALLTATDGSGRRWLVRDGMTEPEFARLLLQTALRGRNLRGQRLRVAGRRVGDLAAAPLPDVENLSVHLPEREQSNTNVVFGEQVIFKLYRKLGEGPNPELEMGEHLTTRANFHNAAPIVGALEVFRDGAPPQTLAVVLTYVPHEDDAWSTFLDYGQRYFEGLDAMPPEQIAALCLPGDPGCAGTEEAPPQEIVTLIAEPLELVRLLGRRTAEMHAALADDHGEEAFRPEPYGPIYQRGLLQSMRNTMRSTFQTITQRADTLSGEAKEVAEQVLRREADIMAVFRGPTTRTMRAARIRNHGDYHLGQVLWTGKDFIIIDFEGEPLRSVGERRLKRSPLRDVAGMVRSFDYAAWTCLRNHWALLPPEQEAGRDRHLRGARTWGAWLAREFVRAYVIRARELRPDLVPATVEEVELLLRAWLLEKALYEIRYELNSRPQWVDIPLRAVIELLRGTGFATVAAAVEPENAGTPPVPPKERGP